MQSSSSVKQLTSSLRAYLLVVLFVGMAFAIGGIATLLPFKALVVVLVLPLSIGFFILAVTRFEKAVLVAIFLAPMIPTALGFRFSASVPLITGQRAILLTLYLAFVFRGVVNKVRLPRFSFLTWFILIVYIGSSIVTSLFSTLPLQSFYRVMASLFDNVGLFVIVASSSANQKDYAFARKALLTLWVSFAVLATLGLIDTLTGFNVLYYLPTTQGDVLMPVYRFGMRRGQGLLPNSTALGVVMALAVILTMLVMTWQKTTLRRKGLWVIGLVNIAALIGTLTRTAWLVALVGIAIWLFSTRQNRLQLILVILVVFVVLVVIGIGSTLYSLVLAGTDVSQQTEVSTLYSRIQWIGIVWSKINANNTRLLFGFGPGSVDYLTLQWGEPSFRAQMTSDYVIRLAEGGLLGLFSFVGVLFVSMRQSLHLIRSVDSRIHTIGVFFVVVFLQMALSSATLPIFVWSQTTYLFWIFWAILVTIRLPKESLKRTKWIISRSASVTA